MKLTDEQIDELIEWCERQAKQEESEGRKYRSSASPGAAHCYDRSRKFESMAQALRELQSCREENERLREDLKSIAKGVVNNAHQPGDWACAECHPDSDILIDGFQCYYHRAKKIMEAAHD